MRNTTETGLNDTSPRHRTRNAARVGRHPSRTLWIINDRQTCSCGGSTFKISSVLMRSATTANSLLFSYSSCWRPHFSTWSSRPRVLLLLQSCWTVHGLSTKGTRRAACRTSAEVGCTEYGNTTPVLWTQLILTAPVSVYVARPPSNSSARADKAILLLPDIYGLAIPYALR